MSDIIELAKKCGATTLTAPSEIAPYRVSFDSESVEAFAAEIRREQDKEIEQLKASVEHYKNTPMFDTMAVADCLEDKRELLEQLETSHEQFNALKNVLHDTQAKLAMMREALEVGDMFAEGRSVVIAEALTATEQEVSAWKRELEAKAIEECARLGEANGNTGLLPFELRALAQDRRSEGK